MRKILRIVGVFGLSLIVFLVFATTAGIIRVQGADTEPALDSFNRQTTQRSDTLGKLETELSFDLDNTQSSAAPTADVDLQALLTDFPDPVKAGSVLTYTVDILNNSTQTATLVTLTDTLPLQVSLIAAVPSQGTCTGRVCDLGTLLGGSSANVTLTAVVDPSTNIPITNQVEVTSFENELVPGDNIDTEQTTVIQEADLSIVKMDDPDPVTAGKPLTYTLVITNHGPSDASNVTLFDDYPPSLSFIASIPGSPTCTRTGTDINCNLGNLTAGASTQVFFYMDVKSGTTNSVNNFASITSATSDPDTSNNQVNEITTVVQSANLSISTVDNPDPVAPGGTLTYTLTIANNGPSNADGVVLTDTLPAMVSLTSITPSQGSCVGTVCALGTIAAAASANVTLVGTVNLAATGSFTNTAEVTSTTPPPVIFTDQEVTSVTSIGNADLAVIKSSTPMTVTAGDILTYTVTITNLGTSDAPNVVLADTLPAEVTFVASTPGAPTCTPAPGSLTCTWSTLPTGGVVNVTILVQVDPGAVGPLTNTADVSSDATDPDTSNNQAQAITAVQQSADLSISMIDNPDPVAPGGALTYTLTVVNSGPSNAGGVVLTDTLPAEVSLTSITPSQGSCTGMVCTLGTINAAGSANVTLVTAVDVAATGTITNTANVSGANDPDLTNNQAQESTTVLQAADLSVSMIDNPDPVLPGGALTYTLTVVNSGPSNAGGVVLTDTLPAEVSLTSIIPSQGSCTGTICTLGTINAAGSASVTLVTAVDVAATGTFTNTADVSGANDPDLTNNQAQESTTVLQFADLSVSMVDNPDPVPPGGALTYTLTIINSGPSNAGGVVLTDTLPAEVSLTSITPSQGSCTGTVCTLGTIAAAGSANVILVTSVDVAATGTITNTANVSGANDPDLTNNQAQESTTVLQAADLSVDSSDFPDPADPGGTLTYTLSVMNNGPFDASGVTLTDTLPTEVTPLLVNPSQGNCTGTVCSLGTISTGNSAQVILVGLIDINAAGVITNTALVSSDLIDPLPGNNYKEEYTTVGPGADLSIIKTASPITVTAGELLTYSLTVNNLGPITASGVIVTDTLPADVTFLSSIPSPPICTESSGVVSCNLGLITPSSTEEVTIFVQVDASASGLLTNMADVSSISYDPDDTNNSTSIDTNVVRSSDIEVNIVDDPDPVSDGGILTYTLTIQNSGPSDARDIVLTDTLPTEVMLTSVVPSQGSCTGTICQLGDLASGVPASVTIVTIVDVISPTVITNTAQVRSLEPDPQMGNNTAEETTTVSAGANLTLIKDSAPNPVVAGETLTYTLTVQNIGPLDADSVQLVDTLPAQVNFVSSTPGAPTCNESNGQVSCNLGDLPRDESTQVQIIVQVDPSTQSSLTNQALVTSLTYDPDEADNQSTETTLVETAADLSLSIVDDPDPVSPGGFLNYTINFDNNGPSVSRDVELTVQLPMSATLISMTPEPPVCSYDLGSGSVLCSFGDVLSGAEIQVSLDLSVDMDASGTLNLQAALSASTADPDGANNSASETTTVSAPDMEPPSVTWVSPVGDDQRFDVGKEVIQLEVDASDNIAIERVDFMWWDHKYNNNEGRWVDIGSVFEPPYSIELDTSMLYYGYNQIYTRAYDTSENPSNRPRILVFRWDWLYLPAITR